MRTDCEAADKKGGGSSSSKSRLVQRVISLSAGQEQYFTSGSPFFSKNWCVLE